MGFGRACAPVRCAHPSFGALKHVQRGAARPPAHRSFAAFSLYFKIKIIYLTRAARVKGFFLSTLPSRLESIQSARPSIQSCELGPPPPSIARECCSPSLWIRRGRHIHFRMRGWGEPIPTMGLTLWYSKYTITIIPRRLRLWNIMSPDPRPSHRSFAHLFGKQ